MFRAILNISIEFLYISSYCDRAANNRPFKVKYKVIGKFENIVNGKFVMEAYDE